VRARLTLVGRPSISTDLFTLCDFIGGPAAVGTYLDKENPRSSGDKIGGVKWGFKLYYINEPTISP
jgi:hypothetical protein